MMRAFKERGGETEATKATTTVSSNWDLTLFKLSIIYKRTFTTHVHPVEASLKGLHCLLTMSRVVEVGSWSIQVSPLVLGWTFGEMS